MRKIGIIAVISMLVVAFVASAALAASPHFKKGGTPVCTVTLSGSSSSTTCTGSLAGLGGGDVDLNTTVSGFAVYQCTNGGSNTPPGQNKVLVGPTTSPTHIPGNEVKNGNLTFTTDPAVLSAPSTVSGGAAGCPNDKTWTGTNPTLTVTDITLTIAQGGQTLFTCTASNKNGLSGRVPLSC